MPLPIIIGIAIAAAASGGAAAGISGMAKLSEAKRKKREGDELVDQAIADFGAEVERLVRRCREYEVHVETVVQPLLDRFRALRDEARALGNWPKGGSWDAKLSKGAGGVVSTSSPALLEILGSTVLGGARGLGAGGAASAAIYALVSQFGTASTGTAIATLSGAAAESATLAAIGGGSVAAGGGGVALGSALLSGVVAAPVFLGIGLATYRKGSKALTRAEEYLAAARTFHRRAAMERRSLQRAVEGRIAELRRALEIQVQAFEKYVLGLSPNRLARSQRAQKKVAELRGKLLASTVVVRVVARERGGRELPEARIEEFVPEFVVRFLEGGS